MMKRIIVIILFLSNPLIIQAIDRGYPFVIFDGKIYKVSEEHVNEEQIGRKIGQVTSNPDKNGHYYGNASNYYPIGTIYYEIKQMKTNEGISVYYDDKYMKAVFIEKAPFHWKNWFIPSMPYLFLLSLVVLYVVREEYRKQVLKKSSF
ncbi:hypothetical protein [Gracilibacillus ureilyticus]|nr:hypothetical protein [Gracilibacillus ureilyticus]